MMALASLILSTIAAVVSAGSVLSARRSLIKARRSTDETIATLDQMRRDRAAIRHSHR